MSTVVCLHPHHPGGSLTVTALSKRQPRPDFVWPLVKGVACLFLFLGAGILAIGHRHSAVVPFRADGEVEAETTKRTVLELVATLDGNYADDIHHSLLALETIGPAAAPAASRLTELLLQNDHTYRGDRMLGIQSRALETLQGIDPNWLSSNQCEQLVAQLMDQLERSRPGFGRTPYVTKPSEARVAAALGLLGPAARPAVQGLILSCASEDAQARERAREALNRIDPDWPKSAEAERCVSRLIEIWDSSPDRIARESASLILKRIEPDWFYKRIQLDPTRHRPPGRADAGNSVRRHGPA